MVQFFCLTVYLLFCKDLCTYASTLWCWNSFSYLTGQWNCKTTRMFVLLVQNCWHIMCERNLPWVHCSIVISSVPYCWLCTLYVMCCLLIYNPAAACNIGLLTSCCIQDTLARGHLADCSWRNDCISFCCFVPLILRLLSMLLLRNVFTVCIELLCLCQWLAAAGILFSGCP